MRDGRDVHTQSSESIAATALVMVRRFQSKKGKAVPVPQGLSSTRADPAFVRLRGSKDSQAGLAGSACGHNLAMVRQKATLR